MMLSGGEVDGREGAAIGLVDRLCETDVVEAALQYAAGLARWPAPAMAEIISCVRAAVTTPERGMRVEGDAVVGLFADGHADAGITAFLEGVRDPRP
jgi:enoyl-CoA hydratase/carnithine racemase